MSQQPLLSHSELLELKRWNTPTDRKSTRRSSDLERIPVSKVVDEIQTRLKG